MAPDGAYEVLQRHAGAPGFDHQPLGILLENVPAGRRAAGARFGHDRADARPHREQPFFGERADDLVGGVGVDLERLAEGADRRKRIAGPQLAGDDGPPDGVDDLLVDRRAGTERRY